MFAAIVAKLSQFGGVAARPAAVVIPLDRPDLMADAGYDGLQYQGPVPRAQVRMDRQPIPR